MRNGFCEICDDKIDVNVCLCDSCSNQVDDWVEETDSYKRKDGKGYYQFNSGIGIYLWTPILRKIQ
jgi:hypothetical protein